MKIEPIIHSETGRPLGLKVVPTDGDGAIRLAGPAETGSAFDAVLAAGFVWADARKAADLAKLDAARTLSLEVGRILRDGEEKTLSAAERRAEQSVSVREDQDRAVDARHQANLAEAYYQAVLAAHGLAWRR